MAIKELFSTINTRSFLAIFWSIISALLIFYILVNFGNHTEILTLIIGMIGGTIVGGIFSVYFGGTNTTSKNKRTNVEENSDTPL